jgi:RNA polymerase sigma factor (sigma-70 family)
MGDPPPSGLVAALARLAGGRDGAAWAVVVEQAGHDCWRCCLSVCDGEVDAADAMQEAFMHIRDDARLFRPGTDGDADARRWIKRVAITTALQWRRSLGRRRRRDAAASPPGTTAAEPVGALIASEELAALRDALAALPEPRRTAIALHHLQGQSLAEVAGILGRPEGTVKTWIHRGLADLRSRLTRRGMAIPASGILVLLASAQAQAATIPLPAAALPHAAAVLHAPGTAAFHLPALATTDILSMTLKAAVALAVLATAIAVPWALAQEGGAPAEAATPLAEAPAGIPVADPADPAQSEAELAVGRGLAWLAAGQTAEGSWRGELSDVGITAIATLALLSSGSTDATGPYRQHIARARDLLLSRLGPDGLISAPGAKSLVMNHHGMATWCLAELTATSDDPRLRPALQRAVGLTLRCQGPAGGWRYVPRAGDADLPSTAGQLRALACARRAGVEIPDAAIAAAAGYLYRCHGGTAFGYMAGQNAFDEIGEITWTAMACAALRCAGQDQDARFLDGMGQLERFAWAQPPFTYHCMARFHAGLALVQCAGLGQPQREAWDAWRQAQAASLLREQSPDGHWQDGWDIDLGKDGGVYATATPVMLLTAQHQRLLAMGRR